MMSSSHMEMINWRIQESTVWHLSAKFCFLQVMLCKSGTAETNNEWTMFFRHSSSTRLRAPTLKHSSSRSLALPMPQKEICKLQTDEYRQPEHICWNNTFFISRIQTSTLTHNLPCIRPHIATPYFSVLETSNSHGNGTMFRHENCFNCGNLS